MGRSRVGRQDRELKEGLYRLGKHDYRLGRQHGVGNNFGAPILEAMGQEVEEDGAMAVVERWDHASFLLKSSWEDVAGHYEDKEGQKWVRPKEGRRWTTGERKKATTQTREERNLDPKWPKNQERDFICFSI